MPLPPVTAAAAGPAHPPASAGGITISDVAVGPQGQLYVGHIGADRRVASRPCERQAEALAVDGTGKVWALTHEDGLVRAD